MKAAIQLLVLALPAMATALPAGHSSPVTRVVELLQDLAKKIEEEGKYEEDLYESYVCWANKVISEKSLTNKKAQSRIDYLKSYMEDIDGGKMEFTSESSDLEAEIKTMEDGIAKAEAQRKKDNEDFLAAEEELELAIKALGKALDVVKESSGKEESLVAMKSAAGTSFSERLEDAAALQRAIQYAKRVLSIADAHFLESVLNGDVPKKDWKKLNRKATFKAKYKSRSGAIFDTLSKMLKTFKSNLADIQEKEKEAEKFHEKLMKSKNKSLDSLKKAYEEGAGEAAAREVVMGDCKAEIEDLEEQLEADTKIIDETTTALADKKAEYKARKSARAKELKAISKAISILYSDDARDLFKKSYYSQTLEFFQLNEVSSAAVQAQRKAGDVLRSAARDGRMLVLALRLQGASALSGPFDKVIKEIEEMMEKLEEQEKEDKKILKGCTKDLKKDTKSAKDTSHDIDGLTDGIEKLEKEIEAILSEIKEKEETIAEIEHAVKEAETQRDLEHKDWKVNDSADSAALLLVKNARDVLEKEYGEGFLQLRDPKDYKMGAVKAGEAPPPPPPTWEGDYENKKDDGGSIVGMLTKIADDIEDDLSKAKKAEDKAQEECDEFVKESKDEIDGLHKSIDDLMEQQAKKKESIAEKDESRASKKGELDALLKKMKDAEPTCNFYAINIDMRKENRALESKGLKEAKKILEEAKLQKKK